jgi:hypothetical protein
MKIKSVILLGLIFTLPMSVQAKFEFTNQEKLQLASELKKESKNSNQSEKTSILLSKIADELNEDANTTTTPKVVKKVGHALGKGSVFISTYTMKPFIFAAGFATGLFEKQEKNKEVTALYELILNNNEQFDKLYLEAKSLEEFTDLILEKLTEIIEHKELIIFRDTLVSLGVKIDPSIPVEDIDFDSIDFSEIDLDKVDARLVNEHPEFQELRKIVGDVTEEDMIKAIETGYFSPEFPTDKLKDAIPKIHEGVIALAGQIFVPRIALGLISKSVAGIYSIPVILADIGSGISAAVCLNKNNKEKIINDPDLSQFCSYVINWSSYQLVKSRSNGFVRGKKLNLKLKNWSSKRLKKNK